MKVGIVTCYDNNNYGNRLQNYAVQQILKKQNVDVETIVNDSIKQKRNLKISNFFQRGIKKLYRIVFETRIVNKRRRNFEYFTNRYIKKTDFCITPDNIKQNLNNDYDYFVAGSDQIWNPNWRLTNIDLLSFAEGRKRIAFSASIGAREIPKEKQEIFIKEIKKFKSISVREKNAEKIIEELTGRKDVMTLLDPTMLITIEEWDKIVKRPKVLNTDKYILTYFLGDLSNERKREIKRVAKENNCKIINLLDKKSKFYTTGPSEFLYLEKNAFLICTDSFHACIFAILYEKPFFIFDREGEACDMMSRIDTLLETFNLQDRKYSGKIDKNMLECNYFENYKILEEERKKANEFIEKALKN